MGILNSRGTMTEPTENLAAGLPVGRVVRSQGRTIGEGDFSALTNITWMVGELHTNRELSCRAADGHATRADRVLGLPAVAAIGVGLGWSHGIGPRLLHRYGIRVLRSLSVSTTAGAPVCPGDTLWSDSCLAEVKSTDDPQQGILRIEHELVNQLGEAVATIVQQLQFTRIQPAEGSW